MSKSKLFAKFATDTNREEAGTWVDFGDGVKFRIRRFKSKASLDARKELDKPFTDELRRGKLDDRIAEDLLIKQMAYGVLADWQGVEAEDGTPLEFNRDNAYKILKALPDLRDEIFGIALDRESFKAKSDADAEGNS